MILSVVAKKGNNKNQRKRKRERVREGDMLEMASPDSINHSKGYRIVKAKSKACRGGGGREKKTGGPPRDQRQTLTCFLRSEAYGSPIQGRGNGKGRKKYMKIRVDSSDRGGSNAAAIRKKSAQLSTEKKRTREGIQLIRSRRT